MAYAGFDWTPSMPGEVDDFTLDFIKDVIPGAPLSGLALVAGGLGYVGAVQLVIAQPSPGGAQATGTASIAGGAVSAPILGAPGSRYLQPPAVAVLGGGGSGASILATLGTPESVQNVISVIVADLNGVDPSPQSRATGNATIDNTQVTQRMSGMLAGANYRILFTVLTTNGRTLELYSHVPCQAAA